MEPPAGGLLSSNGSASPPIPGAIPPVPSRGKSRENEERYLRLAQRDFERARQLYEPIAGFSNVSVALRQVDDDDRARKELDDSLKLRVKRPPRRPVRLRARRWR